MTTNGSDKAVDGKGSAAAEREKKAVEDLLARPAVRSQGRVTLAGGQPLDYGVCCEYLPVLRGGFGEQASDPDAAVFTVAYQQAGAAPAERGVCFAFNGGPGSASIWLHLGAAGPQRVVVPDDGRMPHPPYAVSENPLSWLRHFDLVFIDPPHTGWSLAAGDESRKKLLSVDGDVAALTEVIRAWLTRHRRWNSRVYLAGESYGTTRGAAMADALLDANVALAGLVLVSCAMDLQSVFFSPRNDLPYATYLPALANVAQFHGCLQGPLGASSQAAREAAETFVAEDYLRALHQGARLEGGARKRVAQRLSELLGLPRELVEAHNLRISDRSFFAELLRDRGLQVGRLDARSTGPLGASRSRDIVFDPGIDAIAAPYTMAAMAYFQQSLGLSEERRYLTLSFDAHKAWNWNRGEDRGNSYCSTSDDLSRALRRNPHLRVFAASGRYDLGTPYSATDWSLAQLDIPPAVMARVEHQYYDAGHMMYTRQADLQKLDHDLARWLSA
ncbi:MAG: peptidase S10 [Rubrivivax sp.]|nr:peptidase S10 [Rubrivivax sp.]